MHSERAQKEGGISSGCLFTRVVVVVAGAAVFSSCWKGACLELQLLLGSFGSDPTTGHGPLAREDTALKMAHDDGGWVCVFSAVDTRLPDAAPTQTFSPWTGDISLT